MGFGIKQSVAMAALMSLQLTVTFAIQILIIRATGIGPSTDVYIAAQAVPAVFATVIGLALQSVWLTRLAVASADVNVWKDTYATAQGQAGLMAICVFVGAGCSQWLWLPLLFPGFSKLQNQDAYFFGWVFFVGALTSIQSAVYVTALRVRGRFFPAELIALSGALFSLIAVYFTVPDYGLSAAAWIMLIRSLFVCGAQMVLAEARLPSLWKGFACKEAWVAMRPLLFGAAVYKTAPIIDRYWAAQAPSGGVTVLSLSQTAMSAISSVIERAFCMPAASRLSHLATSGDYKTLRTTYRRSVIQVGMSVVSFYALFVVLHTMIEAALMSLLHVSADSALQIWQLSVLLLGFTFVSAAGTIVSAGFYALNDTSTPPRIGIQTFIVGIFLKSIGFLTLGLVGLVAGITTIYLIMMFMMIISLERKLSFFIVDSSKGGGCE